MSSTASLDPSKTALGGRSGSFLAQHHRCFSTALADTPTLREAAFALRYQVYCLERKFENADEHPNGLEIDAYDAHSIQGVLFRRPMRGAIGSVRMILPIAGSQAGLPVGTLLRDNSLNLADYVNPARTIEVSRFAISKEFHRRKLDHTDGSEFTRSQAGRDANLAFLTLLQFVLRESILRDMLFWTAVMEPKFLRLLARMGIGYTPVGPLVMHHGLRQPCYCYLPDMLETARRVNPQCWNVLTDGGILQGKLAARMLAS
jgi:N-acyl amino acid synthase of PEP-CTERM/exosortase system